MQKCLVGMLVYGTCNPEGYGDSSYEGLYLTDRDIHEITPNMVGVHVKIEHRGVDVGKVVTAWVHEVGFFWCLALCPLLCISFCMVAYGSGCVAFDVHMSSGTAHSWEF